MLKAIVVASALATFASANEQLPRASECNDAYKASLVELQHKQVSPERLVALHRWALRTYDGCRTGDLTLGEVTSLFEHLDR